MFPFVQRLRTDAEGLRKFHLGHSKTLPDIARLGVCRGDRNRLWQRIAVLDGRLDALEGDFRSFLEHIQRIITVAAIANQPVDGADERLIFLTPANGDGIRRGETAGSYFRGFHERDSSIFSATCFS